MNDQNQFSGNVFITGADRGLGLSLVRVYLEAGYRVYAGSYLPDWPELGELDEIYSNEGPGQLTIVSLDVSDLKSVRAAFDLVADQVGGLDILYNNAAIYLNRDGSIVEPLHWDDMKAQFEINALGPLRMAHVFIPLLQKGTLKRLVNISSEAASMGDCWRTGDIGYSMSKACVNRQSVILQRALKSDGIKVYAIHPGYLKTYMLGHRNEEATDEPEDVAAELFTLISRQPDLEGAVYMDRKGESIPF